MSKHHDRIDTLKLSILEEAGEKTFGMPYVNTFDCVKNEKRGVLLNNT
jgi:hypothetical protein